MDNPSPIELFAKIAELDPIQVSHHNPNDDFSDPDLDDIPEDIDDEGPVKGEDVNPHSGKNTGPGIVIRNNLGAFMTNVDPDVALAREFLEYTNIVPTHILDEEFDGEELFVGQQFDNKKDYLHAIKQYSLKLVPNSKIQPEKRVFHRLFWMFDPCVKAFPHCKPIVQVDRTWLYGKYTQILLIVVAQDSNRNVLPIAFTITERECFEF
ncbi:hypothetical protein GOBAR_DD14682 [Gossypium barbadense]|nr:hypothetical protein GOBAR_DD14682 [Gossypium barbadense]